MVKGRRRHRWTWGIGVLLAAGIAFRLFEPVLVWGYGWQPLPVDTYPAVTVVGDDWSEMDAPARTWLTGARAAVDAPALSAAVSVAGTRVWAGATGYADIDRRTPAALDTVFRLGSTSKAMTSIAAGTLIAREAIDLDAPVARYLPDLSAPLSTVTTRQAMSHTAGVRNYSICLCFPIWETWGHRHYDGPQRDVLRPYERDPLRFSPGEAYAYTSLGFNVAGAVIEAASGMRFADYLDREVFTPLGMTASRADTGRSIAGDAAFYDVVDGQYKVAFRVDNTNKLPAGGLLSVPSDLVRLGTEMLDPTLFDPATRDLLMRPQALKDGRPNPGSYGLGWRYESRSPFLDGAAITPRLHHHGTAQGSTSHFTVYPEYGMVVSVMMNRSAADGFGAQADRLAELFATEISRRRAEQD